MQNFWAGFEKQGGAKSKALAAIKSPYTVPKWLLSKLWNTGKDIVSIPRNVALAKEEVARTGRFARRALGAGVAGGLGLGAGAIALSRRDRKEKK